MKFLRNLKLENGTGIVEYGLIVALIAIVSLSSVAVLGHSTSDKFTTAGESLSHDENADTDADTTTTTEATSPDTTTTLPAGSGGGTGDGDGTGETDGGEGGGGGSSPTTTQPTTTTSTTPTTTKPEVTTTTKPTVPDYPIAVAGIDGDFLVTYGYVDKKVVIVDAKVGDEWSAEVTKENKNRIEIEFKSKKTGTVIKTTGWISKGELKTKVDELKSKAK